MNNQIWPHVDKEVLEGIANCDPWVGYPLREQGKFCFFCSRSWSKHNAYCPYILAQMITRHKDWKPGIGLSARKDAPFR